jgi:N-formylglutamate deformylase
VPEIREYELFEVHEPVSQTIPFVYNSPHSGRIYPPEFIAQSRLEGIAIRRSEDHYVDELFGSAVALGAPLLAANFPRAYLDVNREPYELDPALFADRLPDYANTHSLRVIGGLGTIARVVNEQEEIYRAPLTVETALERINKLYKPYHAALANLLFTARQNFGYAALIDLHSMPSSQGDRSDNARVDFVLGDRFGTSCAREMVRCAERFLTRLGYKVTLNKPYAGGYITEHYGKPNEGVHALQIEVNRSLYMDEETLALRRDFLNLRADLTTLANSLIQTLPDYLAPRRTAAE